MVFGIYDHWCYWGINGSIPFKEKCREAIVKADKNLFVSTRVLHFDTQQFSPARNSLRDLPKIAEGVSRDVMSPITAK